VDIHALEARQNTPAGYGTGWSLAAERTEGGVASTKRLDGFVQHNAQHAIVRADAGVVDARTETTTTTRLALAGALVYVGDTFGVTRPVSDSFSLVRIGKAENVRVYVNGQDSGQTGRDGQLIVPDLSSYYENRISFEDQDLPIDTLMPQVQLNVSPPLRSGSCLNFPLQRYQAFTGKLLLPGENAARPLANAELELRTPSGPVIFWTGRDGEFYLDNQLREFDILKVQGCDVDREAAVFLPAGTYPVAVKHDGVSFLVELDIPTSDETYTELGTITLSPRPGEPPSSP
jgi:outer membrane usher protein